MPRTSRPRRGLLSWLTNAAAPVFVLNERRVVLFYNRGCQKLTGWAAADVIGQSCEYVSGGDPNSLATLTGCLCPPPGTLDVVSTHVPAEIPSRDGARHSRTIHYFVLRESADQPARILGIIGPREDPSADGRAAAAQRHAELASALGWGHQQHREAVFVGVSSAARRLREQLQVAAGCSASVHLQGESGTGRERMARLIHARSERRQHAFVPLDCRRIPAIELKLTVKRLLAEENQPEDDLFRAGTVFLKSAGDLPRDVQELLLPRQMQRSVTGWQLISCDDRALADLVASGQLLPEYVDLLSEIVISIPPLRARRDDLPLIAQDILESFNRGDAKQVGGFAPEIAEQFAKYDWPGNIAELEAVIREARDVCTTPLISSRDLPFRFRTGMDAQSIGPSLTPTAVDLEALLGRVELDYIRWALAAAKSNKSQAAALLGLTRPRLYRRMEALGIADEEGPV
jgi:DNA-binding NtrC family response regulator